MRIRALSLVITAFLSNSAVAIDRLTEGFPELPADAQEVAERSLACQHFWGEVNGTGDERDKDVAKQIADLKCDQIESDMKSIRVKYQDNPEIMAVLDEAIIE